MAAAECCRVKIGLCSKNSHGSTSPQVKNEAFESGVIY